MIYRLAYEMRRTISVQQEVSGCELRAESL